MKKKDNDAPRSESEKRHSHQHVEHTFVCGDGVDGDKNKKCGLLTLKGGEDQQQHKTIKQFKHKEF